MDHVVSVPYVCPGCKRESSVKVYLQLIPPAELEIYRHTVLQAWKHLCPCGATLIVTVPPDSFSNDLHSTVKQL